MKVVYGAGGRCKWPNREWSMHLSHKVTHPRLERKQCSCNTAVLECMDRWAMDASSGTDRHRGWYTASIVQPIVQREAAAN